MIWWRKYDVEDYDNTAELLCSACTLYRRPHVAKSISFLPIRDLLSFKRSPLLLEYSFVVSSCNCCLHILVCLWREETSLLFIKRQRSNSLCPTLFVFLTFIWIIIINRKFQNYNNIKRYINIIHFRIVHYSDINDSRIVNLFILIYFIFIIS